jgi:hypothetical protein
VSAGEKKPKSYSVLDTVLVRRGEAGRGGSRKSKRTSGSTAHVGLCVTSAVMAYGVGYKNGKVLGGGRREEDRKGSD